VQASDSISGKRAVAIFRLALMSLLNRRFTALLTVLAIASSVALLLGVEKVRGGARASFTNAISGTDLVVGARGGGVNLLLYAVFRIGDATSNISWQSYQDVAQHPDVAWTIPIALGDTHKGFRVLGTSEDYFRQFRYGRDRPLEFADGRPFADLYDAVLGADVAAALAYGLDQKIVVAHGAGKLNEGLHEDKPFRVVGILKKTGTPVDRTVHISLAGIEAIHIDWQAGAPIPGLKISAEDARRFDLQPKVITAFLVGLKSKIKAFAVQRFVNEYPEEPLLAVLPGVALQELWDLLSVAEQALLAVSSFVVLVGLLGMLTTMLTSLDERRREMAVLRSVGAGPRHIFGLLMLESGSLAVAGAALGVLLLYGLLVIAQPLIEARYGLFIGIGRPGAWDWTLLGIVVAAGILAGVLPSLRAYRQSVADSMMVRI
jgi:putative ABC transport system permease protein